MIDRKRILSLVLPVLALVGAAFAVVALAAERPQSIVTEPRELPPRQTDSGPLVIGATGIIEAASEDIEIAAAVPGVIWKVFAKPGDPVAVGDPLFEVDPRVLQADLALREQELIVAESAVGAAEASIVEAAVSVRDLTAQADRAARLLETAAVSQEFVEIRQAAAQSAEAQEARARSQARQARAAVAQARAAVDSARIALDRATVRSPIEGVVLQSQARPGEYAPTGAGIEPLMVVGQIKSLHIRVDIDEADVPRLTVGEPARFSVRGDPGRNWSAEFVRVEPLLVPKRNLAGSTTERVDTRVLQVIYRLDDLSVPAYVGQQVDVFVPAAQQK